MYVGFHGELPGEGADDAITVISHNSTPVPRQRRKQGAVMAFQQHAMLVKRNCRPYQTIFELLSAFLARSFTEVYTI